MSIYKLACCCIEIKSQCYLYRHAPAVEVGCDVLRGKGVKEVLWEAFEQPAVLCSCSIIKYRYNYLRPHVLSIYQAVKLSRQNYEHIWHYVVFCLAEPFQRASREQLFQTFWFTPYGIMCSFIALILCVNLQCE